MKNKKLISTRQNCPTGCEMSGCRAHKHLISGDCLRQAISKSMTAVEASSFPSFQRREAAQRPGWLVNIRVALLILVGIYEPPPSAPLRNRIFSLMAQPRLENGGE